VPLCLVDAYESSAVQSANTETAYAAQQVHAAESQTDARNQSAMQSAEVKAAQQVHAADSHAAQAQSLMKAAEAKATRAKATAAQAQLAEKIQAAQGAKKEYAAQRDAGNAGAAERAQGMLSHKEFAEYAGVLAAFLSHKAVTHVHAAQSEGASARSAKAKTDAKLSFPLLAPPQLSVVSSLLAAFPVLAILYFLMKKTPKGRAFTDRMSEKISGIIPDKKKPLLSKSYQNLQCSKCFKSVPDQMTICVNHSMFTSNCIDGYSALCPAHKDLVGCSQKYCELAPPHLQVGTEVKRPAQKAVIESVPEHAIGA